MNEPGSESTAGHRTGRAAREQSPEAATRSAKAAAAAPQRDVIGIWRRRILSAIAWGLTLYVGGCVMLGFLQRKLIYLPTRVPSLPAEQSGWPAEAIADVTCRTDDGLTLHGWYVRSPQNVPAVASSAVASTPPGEGTGPHGDRAPAETPAGRPDVASWAQAAPWVVLFFHGNGGHRGCRLPEATLFTRHGADVVLTDYRGYAENPGTPTETGLALDARGWWRWLTAECRVAPQRVIVYGASLGGAVATRLAAELCQQGTPPAGLIVRSTFSSLPDVAAYHYPWLPVRALLAERYDSIDWIRRVTCPILMMHGDADHIVPIVYGERLFEAAPEFASNGVRKRFVRIPGGGHNDLVMLHGETLSAAIEEFLNALRAGGAERDDASRPSQRAAAHGTAE